jgi:hypothetical protein
MVVNGDVPLEKGTHTGSYPGRVLHNPGGASKPQPANRGFLPALFAKTTTFAPLSVAKPESSPLHDGGQARSEARLG